MDKPCEWCKSAMPVNIDKWGCFDYPHVDNPEGKLAVTQYGVYGIVRCDEMEDNLMLEGMKYCPMCGRELKSDG